MVYIHCGEMETTHDNNHNGNGASNSGGVVGYVDATSANGGVGSSDGDGGLSEISCNDIEAIGDGGDTSKNGPMGAKSPCLVANRTGGGICDKATNHGASPFLTKLYLMVDDKATNSIISWGSLGTTFIITDKQELISKILPCYFKTDRFENFISQLNTYVSIVFFLIFLFIMILDTCIENLLDLTFKFDFKRVSRRKNGINWSSSMNISKKER
ncbi:putative transcription factor HSF-type-DNA-binding family [Helianthus annuus]|nr:putative transcription factor HSF-type-DNA-binding family [Helianthus annuus]